MGWLVRRPLVAAMAGVAALLAILIGLETGMGARLTQSTQRTAAKAATPPEAKLLPPVMAQAPEQAFPEMTARPLFTPTRRPAPAEAVAGKPAFTRGQYVLQGVIVVGDQRTALLKEKASGRVHRVDRGKDVNGITVESIDPTEVTLFMGGEREKVALVVQRPEGTATSTGRSVATPSGEPAQGPFGPSAAPSAPAAAVPATAAVNQPQNVSPNGLQAPPVNVNPAARPVPGATNPGVLGASQPTTQPMSPEELLARRRARRNQPTQ